MALPTEPVQGDTSMPVSLAPRSLASSMFLALRTCATHPAGPLRAVSELVDAGLTSEELSTLACELRARVAAMDMPEERRLVASRFLDAIFDGVLCSSLS
jgi:hypothetical protein